MQSAQLKNEINILLHFIILNLSVVYSITEFRLYYYTYSSYLFPQKGFMVSLNPFYKLDFNCTTVPLMQHVGAL